MSKEKFVQTLTDLGLKKTEARIYFYLSKKGPKKGKEIAAAVGITKQRLYPILKNLQNKSVINRTLHRPSKFSAISYEKLLDLLSRTKIEEAKILQQNKGKLLSDWEAIRLPKDKEASAKFCIIKGRNYVYSKIQQMIEETTTQFSVSSDLSGLLHAEQFGVLDKIKKRSLKSDIKFRFITDGEEKVHPGTCTVDKPELTGCGSHGSAN